MFTGLIEEIGIVREVRRCPGSVRLVISAPKMAPHVMVGESISINGACLTAVAAIPPIVEFDAVQETIDKSALRYLRANDHVNMERALALGDRLDGHMVQGHVDGVGRIHSIRKSGGDNRITINAPSDVMLYVVPKGSIAVDGISLTIADMGDDWFTVAIIPQTLAATTLAEKKAGSMVNLETDIIGRYVYKYINGIAKSTDDSLMGKLSSSGFLE